MPDTLPKDPMILLSFVNTQLRDHFPDLDAFCENYNVTPEAVADRLGAIDYVYDAGENRFV